MASALLEPYAAQTLAVGALAAAPPAPALIHLNNNNGIKEPSPDRDGGRRRDRTSEKSAGKWMLANQPFSVTNGP